MGVAAIFGMFAGLYFWFPKMFGRFLDEGIGKVHFWLTFIGVYAIFMPMHYLGLAGNPRRYAEMTGGTFPDRAAAGAQIHHHRGVHHHRRAVDLPVQLPVQPLRGQGSQEENPWHATTLEWSIPSPPPFDNFGGIEPAVYHGPYEFSVPGAADDFIPQHLAPESGAQSVVWLNRGSLRDRRCRARLLTKSRLIDRRKRRRHDRLPRAVTTTEIPRLQASASRTAPTSPRCSWGLPPSSCFSWP